uniref:Uncharacterized protein n=1 Tax=viral metagenome TaxID=1070528 RepID=A0A6M3LVV1_9ZZZZ
MANEESALSRARRLAEAAEAAAGLMGDATAPTTRAYILAGVASAWAGVARAEAAVGVAVVPGQTPDPRPGKPGKAGKQGKSPKA